MTTHPTPGVTASTDDATALVEHWTTDDKRFFANFMCGYSPESVVRFEERRRERAELRDEPPTA